MKTRRFAALAILLLTAAATACAPRVERPEIELVGVRLGGLGIQGGTLYFQIGVANPNGFTLRASGFTYTIELREPGEGPEIWSELADGVFDSAVEVRGNDSTMVEIPVEFRYSRVGAAFRSLLDSGSFNYRVSGTVSVEKPIRTELPYSHAGRADLGGIDRGER